MIHELFPLTLLQTLTPTRTHKLSSTACLSINTQKLNSGSLQSINSFVIIKHFLFLFLLLGGMHATDQRSGDLSG